MSEEQPKKDQEQEKAKSIEKDEAKKQESDPQEQMEGPISSIVQAVKDGAEGDETKEEADQKKDENM